MTTGGEVPLVGAADCGADDAGSDDDAFKEDSATFSTFTESLTLLFNVGDGLISSMLSSSSCKSLSVSSVCAKLLDKLWF